MNRAELQKISDEVLLNPEIKELERKRNNIIDMKNWHMGMVASASIIAAVVFLSIENLIPVLISIMFMCFYLLLSGNLFDNFAINVKLKLIAKTKEKLQQVFKELNADRDLHNYFLYYNWKNEYRIDLPAIIVDDVFVKKNKAPWEDINKIKILQIDYPTRKVLVLLMDHINNEKLTLSMDEIVNDYSNKIFS